MYKEHFNKVKEKTSGNRRPSREDMEVIDAALAKNAKTELPKIKKQVRNIPGISEEKAASKKTVKLSIQV